MIDYHGPWDNRRVGYAYIADAKTQTLIPYVAPVDLSQMPERTIVAGEEAHNERVLVVIAGPGLTPRLSVGIERHRDYVGGGTYARDTMYMEISDDPAERLRMVQRLVEALGGEVDNRDGEMVVYL